MTKPDNPMSFERLGERACLACVSSSPSKIPYGGFSPVRLQTDFRPRSSRAAIRLPFAYTRPGVQAFCPCSPRGHFWRGVCSGRVGPEALGSPTGYVVLSGPRLLWPHPSLPASPTDLCLRPPVFAHGPMPRGSPIYSACPSLRATSLTPADRSAAIGCCFAG